MLVYMCTWPWLWLVTMMATTVNVPRISAVQSNNEGGDLIAHGIVYDDVKYPYIIHVRGPMTTCTGSLIQPLFVLTAAHCSHGLTAKDMKVYRGHAANVGIDPEIEKQVRVIHQHENYKPPSSQTSDLCLLEMESEYKGFENFGVIGGTPEEFANGNTLNCVVIGFGKNETQQSHRWNGFQTNVVARYGSNACATPMPRDGWKKYLCAVPNKQMVCQGDSGGPMICNDKIYGTVKDGYNFKTFNITLCGDPDVQTRHVFLYFYKEWIDNIINGEDYNYYDNDNAPINGQYFTIVAFFVALSLSGRFHSI